MGRQAGQAERSGAYDAPRLTVHGSLGEVTGAALIGPLIDNNHSQGMLIVNNTSP